MRTKRKNRGAILLALCLLAVTLLPSLQVEAASTETVYVLTKYEQDGGYYKSFTYNSDGLVKKTKDQNNETDSYTYKSGRITKNTHKSSYDKATTKYTYDKKNRLTKRAYKDSSFTTTTKLSYDKKNRVSKTVYSEKGPEAMGTPLTTKYTYNKKGYITKEKQSGYMTGTNTYSYDSKGNLKKAKDSFYTKTMKNTYKEGTLTKMTLTSKSEWDTTKTVYKYTYKKVKVPKKYVSAVKAQQSALLKQAIGVTQFVF